MLMSARISRALTKTAAATGRARLLLSGLSTLTPADVQLGRRGWATEYGQDHKILLNNSDARADLAYCLSFATDADDFEKNFSRLFDDRMKEQLEYSKVQFDKYRDVQKKSIQLDTKPLPRTMEDALRQTSRAIVITEPTKPFRVWDVNQTWENLCGYSFVESKGKTLGSLLRGDDTDQLATTAMISRLLSGEEAGATLTNYTKSGRRFRNRVRIGPIFDETERVTHFVGVLQEIHDGY